MVIDLKNVLINIKSSFNNRQNDKLNLKENPKINKKFK